MITDILTVAMKEIKELPYLRKDNSRTNLFTLIILLTVFGILLPWHAGKEWVQSLLSMLPCVWLPFSLVGTTMVDSFAGERERHTLETLLASRLSDRAILFGKILAGILYGAVITFLCMLVSLVTVNLVDGQAGLLLYPMPVALGLVILVLLVSTLASALGVLVSLRAASVRQAMQTFTIANAVLLIPVLVISTAASRVACNYYPFHPQDFFFQSGDWCGGRSDAPGCDPDPGRAGAFQAGQADLGLMKKQIKSMQEKFMLKNTMKLPAPPNNSTEFDHWYQSPIMHWVWSDVHVPQEIKALVQHGNPRSVLELGCGLGIFSRYVAWQGLCVTGVDFSPVAIAKARGEGRP